MKDSEDDGAVPSAKTDADWFFSQNLALYTGEWVAVLERKILAHGKDLKQVYADAKRKAAPRRPLFYSVPTGMSGGA
jgi:hypothetical protein